MSLKVIFTSDLHVDVRDFGKTVEQKLPVFAAEMAPDVFIIAGDVSATVPKLKAALTDISKVVTCPKLFVPGNHDIWVARSNQTLDSWQKNDDVLPNVCTATGFHYLPGNPIEIAGVGFAGTMGWYDYSLRNRKLDEEILLESYRRKRFQGRVWNDKYYARWNKTDEEVSQEFTKRLDADLSTFDSRQIPVVCVTHHLPFSEFIRYTEDPLHDYFAAFMGSTSLGVTILKHPQVRYVISGHAHRPREQRINGVLALTSPIGYEYEIDGLPEEHIKRSLRTIEVEQNEVGNAE